MSLNVTGAATQGKTIVTTPVALPIPVVAKADLDDAANPINDTRSSGKAPGGLLLAQDGANYTIVTASGTETTSTWITVGAATSVVYTTPA